MVDREGRLRVLDFGLARVEGGATAEGISQLPTQTMTQAGTVLGTYPYMSPEQAQGQVADARSDLFSLGIILYEMATGRRPFTGETGVSLISSILKDAPTPIGDVKAGLPAELGSIIERKAVEAERARLDVELEPAQGTHELELPARASDATSRPPGPTVPLPPPCQALRRCARAPRGP